MARQSPAAVVVVQNHTTGKRDLVQRDPILFLADLRKHCEQFFDFTGVHDRSWGSFFIGYGGKVLGDDAVPFETLQYPRLSAHDPGAPAVVFGLFPEEKIPFYHPLGFPDLWCSHGCSIATLRHRLATIHAGPSPHIGHGQRLLEPKDFLRAVKDFDPRAFSLGDCTGYRFLKLRAGASTLSICISESASALDIVALLQAREFRAKRPVLEQRLEFDGRAIDRQSPVARFWKKDGNFSIVEGDRLPNGDTDISYRFGSSRPLSQAVPSGATLAFVRALIAIGRQVPPDQITLCDANRARLPMDQRVSAVARGLPLSLSVYAPQISLSYRTSGLKTNLAVKVALTDRVLEFKRRVAPQANLDPWCLLVSWQGRLLGDAEPLAPLAAAGGPPLVLTLRKHPLVTLLFKSLDENSPVQERRITNLGVTFKSLAVDFPGAPSGVELLYLGKELPLATSVALFLKDWDPEDPILFLPSATVPRQPREFSAVVSVNGDAVSFPVTEASTVRDLIGAVSRRAPVASLALDSDPYRPLDPNQRLLAVSPGPVRLFVAHATVAAYASPPAEPAVTFRCGSSPPFSLPLARCRDVRSARAAIAAHLKRNSAVVTVLSDSAVLRDDAPLTAGRTYAVSLAKSLIVSLIPSQPLSGHRPLERQIALPEQWRTIAHVARSLLHPPLRSDSVNAFVDGTRVPPEAELARFPDGATLRFEHALPLTGRLSFKVGDHHGSLDVDDSITVNAVKARLLSSWGWNALPAVLVLCYFNVCIEGDFAFVAYGIPAGTEITCRLHKSERFRLTVCGKTEDCNFFPHADTVRDLRAFLAWKYDCSIAAVTATSGGEAVDDAAPLTSVAAFGVEAAVPDVHAPSPQPQYCPTQPQPQTASRLQPQSPQPPSLPQFFGASPQSHPPSQPQPQSPQRPSQPPAVEFLFNGGLVRIPLDRKRPLAELRPLIARALGIQGAFAVHSHESEVDDEMPLTDELGDLPNLQIRLTAAPEAVLSFQVMLCASNAVPLFRSCTLPRTAQLSAVEADLRGRGLVRPDWRVEFVIDDAPESVLPKTAQICDFDLNSHSLAAMIGADEGHSASTVAALASQLRSSLGGEIVAFNFVLAEAEPQRFSLPFGPAQTVRDAKRAILSHYGRNEDVPIALLYAGKALRDDFVLGRLRIGKDEIVVFLKSDRKFRL
jgi:hypothetical protein